MRDDGGEASCPEHPPSEPQESTSGRGPWSGFDRVDHLVYAVPDLREGVERIRDFLGVEAVPGGRHPRWGTRNALVGLGTDRYLEIIAPDPDAPEPEGGRPFGLDGPAAPRLASWAVRTPDLAGARDRILQSGVDPGAILEGSRERTDGSLLRWRLTDPTTPRADGLIPFLIDWGDSPHPAADLPDGLRLRSLRGEHPAPATVRPVLEALDLELPLGRGPRPALTAIVEGAYGRRELR